MRTGLRAMFVALSVLSAGAAQRAEACAHPGCWSSSVVPGNGATVPANLPALRWRQGLSWEGDVDAGAVTLVNLDGGAAVALTFALEGEAYTFVPAGFEAGERYFFSDGFECWGEISNATITIGPSMPLPTTLGTLQIDEQTIDALTVMTAAGSCSESMKAVQRLAMLQPSAEAKPWMDAFLFETLVDGHTWSPSHDITSLNALGASWAGRGRDRFFRRCSGASDGLAEGQHQAIMRATLPGTDVRLETAPVSFELACEAPPACGCSSGAGAVAVLALFALRRRR